MEEPKSLLMKVRTNDILESGNCLWRVSGNCFAFIKRL